MRPVMTNPADPTTVEKYVDPLPIPPVLQPEGILEGATFYQVEMRPITQKLHRDFPETPLWGYEGSYPGPTIEVRTGEHVKVKWINNLPVNEHLLPVDTTVHGAEPNVPRVRTVVHLHGGNTPAGSDGHPEAWFTNGFGVVGPAFETEIYDYPNNQPATTLWFHDHAVGITRLNVYAGLAAFYIIRDCCEDQLNLPGGQFEIPIVIQDRSFNSDGSLFYPRQPDPPVPGVDPSIVPEFFGNTIVVNGKVWPFLEVEPRKYRFRLLNGSNSRFYQLKLSSGQPFIQIGAEGGLLPAAVQLTEITLGPAERADVILDFSQLFGQTIIMTNEARSPFPGGESPGPETVGQIMQFRVTLPLSSPDTSSIPTTLCPLVPLKEADALRTRDLTLVESTDEYGRLLLLLTGRMWDEPITENPELGSIEIWNLINLTMDTHPIHLHLVRFQVLERRDFDVAHFEATGDLLFTGPPIPPDPNETGFKDTVRANPGQVTRLIAKFCDFAGEYVWHCHILEHEDHEMMRPYMVGPEQVGGCCDGQNCCECCQVFSSADLRAKFGVTKPGEACRCHDICIQEVRLICAQPIDFEIPIPTAPDGINCRGEFTPLIPPFTCDVLVRCAEERLRPLCDGVDITIGFQIILKSMGVPVLVFNTSRNFTCFEFFTFPDGARRRNIPTPTTPSLRDELRLIDGSQLVIQKLRCEVLDSRRPRVRITGELIDKLWKEENLWVSALRPYEGITVKQEFDPPQKIGRCSG